MSIINTVAAPFEPLLELVYAAFRDEHIAVFFAVTLIGSAVFVYLFFRFVRIQPFYSTLLRLNRAVIAYPDTPSFCENFQNIDEAFKKEGSFSHAWAEFGETLVHPEADEQKVIRNTTRPASYLNVHAAIESGLPLPGYQAMPNYFVGIGLLFTFLGLVAGLHYAAEGVNSPNVKEAQKALEILLKVASFKFLTSIAGILSSLFLS